MSTRGGPGHANAIGIDAVLGGVGAKIAHSTLAVLDIGREGPIATEAIKQTRGDEPLLREQHCPGVAVLIAALPAAAMDPEHRRRGGAVALLGEEDVHQQRLAPTGAI